MILYDQIHKITLTEFGIQIPVHNSRVTRTFKHLCEHPVLGKQVARWHIPRIEAVITRSDLLRAHSEPYVAKLFSEDLEQEIVKTFELVDANGHYHRYDPRQADLPLKRLFDRLLQRVAGSYQCGQIALENEFCFFFGGGMHHAHLDHGAGFCLVNDIVIAIRRLQAERRIRNAWVIDVDAHKGDGTAAITAEDPTVITLSIHMAAGWPLDELPRYPDGTLKPAFISSDIDIPIARGQEDQYTSCLKAGLEQLKQFEVPDIAYVVSGADPYTDDELPSTQQLKLSLTQLMERDRLVYDFLQDHGVPGAYLMAGGYGRQTWRVYAQFLQWALLKAMKKF